MAKPFDFIESINDHEPVDAIKGYDQYLTNRFYSYFIDTIMYASEAATFQNIGDMPHYQYYLDSIKPKKRFTKWFKSEKIEDLEIISAYNDCSYEEARRILQILSEEQLAYIRDWYEVFHK